MFPHLVSVVILRAQTWNGLPNLTCCKGKLIAVQIVKSNQSTAAISVSNYQPYCTLRSHDYSCHVQYTTVSALQSGQTVGS